MKIICKKTALELIDELYRKHSEKTKSEKRMLIATEFAHKTVMTNYGKSKLYIIEEVLFDVTLEEHRFMIPKHG